MKGRKSSFFTSHLFASEPIPDPRDKDRVRASNQGCSATSRNPRRTRDSVALLRLISSDSTQPRSGRAI